MLLIQFIVPAGVFFHRDLQSLFDCARNYDFLQENRVEYDDLGVIYKKYSPKSMTNTVA